MSGKEAGSPLDIGLQTRLDLGAVWCTIEFPSKKNRHAATGCPLTAFRVVSGIRTPFRNWCAMTTKSVLSRKVQLAFGSAILTLLVVGAISCRGMVMSSESGSRFLTIFPSPPYATRPESSGGFLK